MATPLLRVAIEGLDLEFIERASKAFGFTSKDEYIQLAIQEKIRADRGKLREIMRRHAMVAYGGDFLIAFDSIEAEAFAER